MIHFFIMNKTVQAIKCESSFRNAIFLLVSMLLEHLLHINFVPKDNCHLLQRFTFASGQNDTSPKRSSGGDVPFVSGKKSAMTIKSTAFRQMKSK